MSQNNRANLVSQRRLEIDGYLYVRSFERKNSTYWDCIKVREKECKARAVTTVNASGGITVLRGPLESKHSHGPNRDAAEAERIKEKIRNIAAAHPERKPSVIIRDALAGKSGGVVANLPERENLKKGIRRERRRNAPPNPRTLIDLEDIPDVYKKTVLGDNFLIYDSRAEGEIPDGRVLVFSTKRNLEVLKECYMWSSDGTFKVSPTIFTQVFSILGYVPAVAGDPNSSSVPLPLVYALLSSKSQLQYEAVYKAVLSAAEKHGLEDFIPDSIMSDFELGIINAGKSVFPEVDMQCCFFHLKQSAYRHIQQLGLQIAYNDPADSSVRDFCHMMAGLAYVPECHVKDAFRALKRITPDVQNMLQFVQYFDETYVNGIPGAGARRRIAPLYEPALWNVYESTLQGKSATNNASEGWHNRFAQMLDRKHPDLYTLLDAIKKEQEDTEISILELRIGKKIKAAPKKKWVDFHNRVQTTVKNYQAYGTPLIIEYLKLVSYHISFA